MPVMERIKTKAKKQ